MTVLLSPGPPEGENTKKKIRKMSNESINLKSASSAAAGF
jgi:hypothetical protein